MARANRKKQVVLLVFPGVSLLELVGAHYTWSVAGMLASFETVVASPNTDFIPSSTPLSFRPEKAFAEAPDPDIFIVVGGFEAALRAAEDPALLDYVRHAAQRAAIVASTGTGSLILAAAGLLDGKQATTHWAFRQQLEGMGARYRRQPWVEDGRFITGAGSSSAVDMSLMLIDRLSSEKIAKQVQIGAEWDPAPPFGGIDWTKVNGRASGRAPGDSREPVNEIALVIYDGLTVFDLAGPLELLSALSRIRPDFQPVVVAERVEPLTSDDGLTFMPNRRFAELPAPHALVVPGGGRPTLRAMSNPAIRDYIRSANETTTYTASVCTGALLLASTGMLAGREATTHWAYERYLPAYGARYVRERWVASGKIVNSAGVSAGIDMALYLIAQLVDEETARQVQRATHYDPAPPFGGIDYDRLPVLLRALRTLTSLQVPLYVRKPRQLLRQGL